MNFIKLFWIKPEEEHLPKGDPLLSLLTAGEREESIALIIVLRAWWERFKHHICHSAAAPDFLSQSKLSAVTKSAEQITGNCFQPKDRNGQKLGTLWQRDLQKGIWLSFGCSGPPLPCAWEWGRGHWWCWCSRVAHPCCEGGCFWWKGPPSTGGSAKGLAPWGPTAQHRLTTWPFWNTAAPDKSCYWQLKIRWAQREKLQHLPKQHIETSLGPK